MPLCRVSVYLDLFWENSTRLGRDLYKLWHRALCVMITSVTWSGRVTVFYRECKHSSGERGEGCLRVERCCRRRCSFRLLGRTITRRVAAAGGADRAVPACIYLSDILVLFRRLLSFEQHPDPCLCCDPEYLLATIGSRFSVFSRVAVVTGHARFQINATSRPTLGPPALRDDGKPSVSCQRCSLG